MTDPTARRDAQAQSDANRRRYRRHPLASAVRVSTIDSEFDPASGRSYFRTSHETSVDFSRGGLSLRTGDPMRPGRRVLIEVADPDGETIEAVGRVAWVRVDPRNEGAQWIGVGVEFLGGQASAISRLDAMLATSS
jgi:hypothetical protein